MDFGSGYAWIDLSEVQSECKEIGDFGKTAMCGSVRLNCIASDYGSKIGWDWLTSLGLD
jgi:hypothetical protein